MLLSAPIALDGCLNFRDLGGYPCAEGSKVRGGLLYRSDALHHLTPSDIAKLRDELAIAEVLDLRSSGELRSEGRGRLEHEAMLFHHLPLFDGDASAARAQASDANLADRYFLLAEFARDPIAKVITVLAETSRPAVYHCAAGKDRTGVISAILLGILGVADDVIIADYALSGRNLDAIIDRLMKSTGYQEMFAALPPETLHANPETMHGFLALLHARYGSMRDYARAIGVSTNNLDRLRARLLAPA